MPGADDMYQEYGWGFAMFVIWRNQFVPCVFDDLFLLTAV